eukprot:TRINITY_DN23890_c0_g1_i1.p2 TRINITY_DN23890_c0_g1~~TRINITY_DN23890_c0_g1_i1.p2  ORF type:complete len:145 (-),score=24.14 TRINITY_DN23890_c0_g1_i1:36-470(-)
MVRRPPRSTHCISSAASDVYKRQGIGDIIKCVYDFPGLVMYTLQEICFYNFLQEKGMICQKYLVTLTKQNNIVIYLTLMKELQKGLEKFVENNRNLRRQQFHYVFKKVKTCLNNFPFFLLKEKLEKIHQMLQFFGRQELFENNL